MKISLNWLSDFVDLDDLTVDQISELLTNTGLEVEGVESYSSVEGGLEGLVVAEVVECTGHPNADKLKLTKVSTGNGLIFNVVCGAPNVAKGQKVIFAQVGTKLYPASGDPFLIKKAKIRGEVSEGMICAEDEIGLGNAHHGIIVLEEKIPVGTKASEVMKVYTDQVFEIGITPNRSDALSHFGTARDLAVVLNRPLKTGLLDQPLKEGKDKPVEIILESPEDCPRYSGITMRNVKLGASPEWMQNRLSAVGAKCINNVVDATNYAMLELGHPLHAFDLNKIEGDKIVVKRCSHEKLKFLDGVERQLNQQDLGIYNEQKLMALAGVMGGEDDSISETSESIFIESAYFNPVTIRKSSKHHGLKTDAAFRFERGTDPTFTIHALQRACALIKEIAGAEVSSSLADNYALKQESATVELEKALLWRYAGNKLPEAEVARILKGLDFVIKSNTENSFELLVPPYRVDVTRPVDVIEEILRIYGYNNLPDSGILKYRKGYPLRESKYNRRNSTAFWLASQGFNEIKAMSLVSAAYINHLELDKEAIPVLNPLSEELNFLRIDLLAGGLLCIARNQNRQISNQRLFEFGKIHSESQDKYKENRRLGIWITGLNKPESWIDGKSQSSLLNLKGIVTNLLETNGISGLQMVAAERSGLSEGYSLNRGRDSFATIGEVDSRTLEFFGINQSVYFASIEWDKLERQKSKKIKYEEPAKYPQVERDLALLIPNEVKFEQVEQVIRKIASKLLVQLSVFDRYKGKGIPEGTSSVAVRLILQDKDQTLKDKKVEGILNRIILQLEKDFNIRLR